MKVTVTYENGTGGMIRTLTGTVDASRTDDRMISVDTVDGRRIAVNRRFAIQIEFTAG